MLRNQDILFQGIIILYLSNIVMRNQLVVSRGLNKGSINVIFSELAFLKECYIVANHVNPFPAEIASERFYSSVGGQG